MKSSTVSTDIDRLGSKMAAAAFGNYIYALESYGHTMPAAINVFDIPTEFFIYFLFIYPNIGSLRFHDLRAVHACYKNSVEQNQDSSLLMLESKF